jgi:molybdopterin synthase sulfur carrier subunit
MVKVLFFAKLREQLDCEGLNIDPRTVTDTSALKDEVVKVLGEQSREYLFASNIICSVNQEIVEGNVAVAQDDEVAFFPPVTGG